MEPRHFPTDNVTLCCPLITKAARKQGDHREKWGSSSFCDGTVVMLYFFNNMPSAHVIPAPLYGTLKELVVSHG